MKPSDISSEAMEEAERVALFCNVKDAGVITIARAIDAATARATERAALIADEHHKSPRYTDWPYATACADIAAAIRQGSQPSTQIPHRGEIA